MPSSTWRSAPPAAACWTTVPRCVGVFPAWGFQPPPASQLRVQSRSCSMQYVRLHTVLGPTWRCACVLLGGIWQLRSQARWDVHQPSTSQPDPRHAAQHGNRAVQKKLTPAAAALKLSASAVVQVREGFSLVAVVGGRKRARCPPTTTAARCVGPVWRLNRHAHTTWSGPLRLHVNEAMQRRGRGVHTSDRLSCEALRTSRSQRRRHTHGGETSPANRRDRPDPRV